MTRTPSPWAVALRNQLLAILRDAEQPLTTQQVAGRVTGSPPPSNPNCASCTEWATSPAGTTPIPTASRKPPRTKRLSRHLAEADSRCAYWRCLDADAHYALNALLDAVQDA